MLTTVRPWACLVLRSEVASNPRDQAKADQLLALTELVLAKVAQVEGSVESAAPVVAAAKREKKKLAGLNDALSKGTPAPIILYKYRSLFSFLFFLL